MASIHDIAKRAGVSISTVSRVMNRSANVEEDKASRVLEAMEHFDYMPSQLGRGLRRRSTQMIALVVPSSTLGAFETGFLKGACDLAMSRGYSLVLAGEEASSDGRPSYLELALQKKVDGLIFSMPPSSREMRCSLDVLERNHIAYVHVGRRLEGEGGNVYARYEEYTKENLEYLHRLGHRSVLLMHSQMHGEYVSNILEDIHSLYPDFTIVTVKTGGRPAGELLSDTLLHHVVDGCCTAMSNLDSEDLPVLVSLLSRFSIRVPEDLSVIVTENSEDAHRDIYPSYSARVVPSMAMGRCAAGMLLDMLNGVDGDASTCEFDATFIERHSVKRKED